MTSFMQKLQSVKPWITRHVDPPMEAGEYLQTPAEVEQYKGFSMCINCMLCYAACPVVGRAPDFLGPAVIALAHGDKMDCPDQGQAERQRAVPCASGIWAVPST